MKPVRRILVPTDFSEPSDAALEYATALAGRLGASINLIHVLHYPFAAQAAWEFYVPEPPEVQEKRYQDARSRLANLAARSADSGVPIGSEEDDGHQLWRGVGVGEADGRDAAGAEHVEQVRFRAELREQAVERGAVCGVEG